MAETSVTKVRTSVHDLFFRNARSRNPLTDEQRGLRKTIVEKEEWDKQKKRYETAIRLFHNKNNNNNSDNTSNNNTNTTPSRKFNSMALLSSTLSASDTIAAAVSSTTGNGNNVTHQPSSLLSSNLQGKKRKQHEMV